IEFELAMLATILPSWAAAATAKRVVINKLQKTLMVSPRNAVKKATYFALFKEADRTRHSVGADEQVGFDGLRIVLKRHVDAESKKPASRHLDADDVPAGHGVTVAGDRIELGSGLAHSDRLRLTCRGPCGDAFAKGFVINGTALRRIITCP